MNGFIIAGTHSGCGKTTITLGLLAALKKRGLKVQPFKAGPDFIDAGLHRFVTGRHSRNLDIWMCGDDYVKECFHKYSADADIAVVEGVMGMYDGEYSTAKLSRLLKLPVILVVDAYGMAESAGAVVKGFMEYRAAEQQSSRATGVEPFDSALLSYCATELINGVIFNRVASDNHFKRLKDSVQVGDSTLRDVTVLGYLPRDLDFEIPHRHLGLTVAEETPIAKENIAKLADSVLEHIDVEKIIEQQSPAPYDTGQSIASYSVIPACPHSGGFAEENRESFFLAEGLWTSRNDKNVTIAIAYDKAFCFYYEDNIDLLKDAGAEIVKFSPLFDSVIPDQADAVYIGGGYPELYAKELSENISMMKSINDWAISGRPMYAECGGLMYLSKGIYDFSGNFFEMAGVFSFETKMKKGRLQLGYREIKLKDNCILGKKGDKLKGHEFHYSEIKDSSQFTVHSSQGTVPDLSRLVGIESGLSPSARKGITDEIYSVRNNHGEFVNASGYAFKNTLASYIHAHFSSNLNTAKNFMESIKEQQWKT